MRVTRKHLDELTYQIIGAAIEVHKHLGPGLLESVYQKCMLKELAIRDLKTTSQQKIPFEYKGMNLDADLRFDILVEDLIIVELKAVDGLSPIHEAILLT